MATKTEVTTPENVPEDDSTASPTESENTSSDPCLFQAEPNQDAPELLSDIAAVSTQVQVSSPPQYFPYDQAAAASPPQGDFVTSFSYADYLIPTLGLDSFQLEGWDDLANGRSSQFFDELFFQ
jgi:hypothetical protein